MENFIFCAVSQYYQDWYFCANYGVKNIILPSMLFKRVMGLTIIIKRVDNKMKGKWQLNTYVLIMFKKLFMLRW